MKRKIRLDLVDIFTYFAIFVTIIVWIIVGFLVYCHFSPDTAKAVVSNVKYELIEPIQNENFREIYPNVYVDEEIDAETEQEYAQKFELYMKDLPLYKYDYKIILTNEDLSTNLPEYAQGHKIAAITISSEKTIKIRYERYEYSILHEIGHAVDRYEDYSQTAEFQELYNMVEHDTYYTCDAREYFAYCYNLYVVDSLGNQPHVKAYFDRLVYGYSMVIGG